MDKRYKILLGLVFAVVSVWTAGWFVVRHQLDLKISRSLSKLSDEGFDVACTDRSISGFPFRFEVSCTAAELKDLSGGETVSFAGFRSVALVYNPWHIIFEADSPALFIPAKGNDQAWHMKWETARSSVKHSMQALKQLDIEISNLEIVDSNAVLENLLKMKQGQVHLRQVPENTSDLEVAAVFAEGTSLLLPASLNTVTLKTHTVLKGAAGLLANEPLLQNPAEGLPLEIGYFQISSGNMLFDASGNLLVDPDGLISGHLDVELTNFEQMMQTIRSHDPSTADLVDTLSGFVLGFGKKTQNEENIPVIKVPLTFSSGRVSVGLLPLGALPPLKLY